MNEPPKTHRNIFTKLLGHWKTRDIKRAIERELDQAMLKSEPEPYARSPNPQIRSLKRRTKSRYDSHRPIDKFAGRSLPAVLRTSSREAKSEDQDFLRTARWRLLNLSLVARRALAPNLEDHTLLAEERLAKHVERVCACQQMLQDAIARQQASGGLGPNGETSQAFRVDELSALRLFILKQMLAQLESEEFELQAELFARQAQLTSSHLRKTEELLKSTSKLKPRKAVAEIEEQIAKREALASAGTIDAKLRVVQLKPEIFEPLQKQVEQNEAQAREFEQKIANFPESQVESVSVEELKQAAATFSEARMQIGQSLAELNAIERLMKELRLKHEDTARVWKDRQLASEQNGNPELVYQAGLRLQAYLDAAAECNPSIDTISAAREQMSQRLELIDSVLSKLRIHLMEFEAAN